MDLAKLGAPATSRSEIDRLSESVREFRDRDISHPELGTANGFQVAQDLRVSIADYFLDLLQVLREVADEVDPTVREAILKRINDEGQSLSSIEDSIEQLAKDGVHTQGFPAERTAQLNLLRERGATVKLQLQVYEGAIRAKRLERLITTNLIAEAESAAQEKLLAMTRIVAEATKALENLQTNVMTQGIAVAASTFNNLTSSHKARENAWFIAFIVTAMVTVSCLIYVITSTMLPASGLQLASLLVRRLLLVSAPAVFMKLALGKYNLERNLRIIYAHREAVLAQYRIFESAIGDDTSAKNQFRLEIAKYIFSDPITGYVSQDTSSEINISPMVGMLEKVSGR